MRELQVHFTHRQQPDHPLKPGVHRIVRHASGNVRLVEDTQGALLLAQFCLDQRGLWLQVANGIRGIHVNGRPVRRMALLRPGDAVYADGVEMVLRTPLAAQARIPATPCAAPGDPLMLLRGVGGRHHGRSFTLDQPRVVGSEAGVDILIDDAAFAPRHARLEPHDGRVLLRDLGSHEGSVVNGLPVRDCWLQPGDQLVFDTQHRFVLEVPVQPALVQAEPTPDLAPVRGQPPAAGADAPPRARVSRWPWLLLSAVLLAAVLSALLWFGAR
ncbi:MAG TPA: FHA domain-containing protein [Stenotrophomonas sp.]|nr:FHA domain-containing protein [Stenotrophomonas sp.]